MDESPHDPGANEENATFSPDGRFLAYDSDESFGAPQPLFSSPTATTRLGRQYDVSPDGKRFLLNEAVGLETASPIVVVIPEAD